MDYKLRSAGQYRSIAVPPEVAQAIPENARFTCELTEEGILYRIRLETEPGLPSWARKEDESSCRPGG